MRSSALAAFAMLLFALSPACATYHDDLARGQHAFEQNQHERALAVFRALEPDASHLTTTERGRYAYLRGMTDYRIGYKLDAHHWLAVAKALDTQTPGLLPSEWRTRLDEALLDLDTQVYAGGLESLSTLRRRADAEPAHRAKPKATEPDDEEEDDPKLKKRKPVDDDE